jgi:hypothetical protein
MSTRRHLVFAALAASLAMSASAQHGDIALGVDQNQLVTLNDADLTEERVFRGGVWEAGVPGFTDDPGYSSNQLAPGSFVGFNVADRLLYWDGVEFVEPPGDERIQILLLGTPLVTVTQDSSPQPGFNFAQASGSGQIHQHIQFWAQHSTFDPGDPFTNPISVGAYALFLEQTSSAHETSRPYAIVFNHNLGAEEFEAGLEAVRLLLEGCPGDIDGDSQIGLSDLAIQLANFGVPSGATPEDGDLDGDGDVDLTDLASMLSVFGESCS